MKSWSSHGWTVTTNKGPIASAGELNTMERDLDLPLPEMVFVHNQLQITHHNSGFKVVFNARDALAMVDNKHSNVQVAHSAAWKNSRLAEDGINKVGRMFDWTYSTTYKGTVLADPRPETVDITNIDTREIPRQSLASTTDPILFFDEVALFEDELGDNGLVQCTAKVRVMNHCILVLCRLFVRVDHVVLRVYDTRYYIEFAASTGVEVPRSLVIRESRHQQSSYDRLKLLAMSSSEDFGQFLRDANWVSANTPLQSEAVENVYLKN